MLASINACPIARSVTCCGTFHFEGRVSESVLNQLSPPMASKQPTQAQQGVTKQLSGANASFKDKVRPIFTFEIAAERVRCRANRWSCACQIWSQPKVNTTPSTSSPFLKLLITTSHQ